ncbi:MAG: helix-turn-helix domain-containing protein [Eubacterium sp.]|nr:helix-turn-helix domain-containing protein [Eubacterium sp.]
MDPYEQIRLLESQLEAKKEYIAKLEAIVEQQNSRGAGRKRKITDKEIEMIRGYRQRGYTYAEIAENFGISVGSVHRYCNNLA